MISIQKRGLHKNTLLVIVVSVLFVISSPLVLADHNATVTLSAPAVYETTSALHKIYIDNFGSTDVITTLQASTGDLVVTKVNPINGWNSNFTSNSVTWSDGTIETNVESASFRYHATSPQVNQNETFTFQAVTTDSAGFSQNHNIQVTILDDVTGPSFSSQSPSGNVLLSSGNSAYAVSIDATDDETGVASVTFSYGTCNAEENIATLAKNDNTFSATLDLSSLTDGTHCYTFTGTSNGGATTTSTGQFTIDGTPPTVAISSPEDNAVMGGSSTFSFTPTDNLASTLLCALVVDGTTYSSGNVTNNQAASFSASTAPDGQHTWNIKCTDGVGLSGQSADRTYHLDKTAPIVTVNPGNNSVIAEGTSLAFTVADSNGVGTVQYTINGQTSAGGESFTVSTTGWGEGSKTVTVTAQDSLGNNAQTDFTFNVDKTAPTITLTSPAANAQVDYHAVYAFNAADNYDTNLTCSLYLDDAVVHTQTEINGASSVAYNGSLGIHSWKVLCADHAGNTGTSEERTVQLIDASGPDMQFGNTTTFVRGNSIQVLNTITDPSGVQGVSATLTTPSGTIIPVNVTLVGTDYALVYPTTLNTPLGTYTATFTAQDNQGFQTTQTKQVTLTYGYKVTVELDPDQAVQGSTTQVSASGTVTFDNGTGVSENQVYVHMNGDGAHVDLTDGNFVYTFTTPASTGDYDVTAQATSGTNGVTYSGSKNLEVLSPSSSSSTTSGTTGRIKGSKAKKSFSEASKQVAVTTSTAPSSQANNKVVNQKTTKQPVNQKDQKKVSKVTGNVVLGGLGNPKFFWTLFVLGIVGMGMYAFYQQEFLKGFQHKKHIKEQDAEIKSFLEKKFGKK